MALPFLLAGAAIAAGIFGIAKGAKSVSNNREAQELNEKALRVYEEAREYLEHCRELATSALSELGEIKLRSWSVQLGQFVALAGKVTEVHVSGGAAVDEYRMAVIGKEELLEMRGISLNARAVVAGGLKSLGAGALAGVAAYGGTMMFASASTGTAISALTGAAATNATLAWLGGGSLAAGGLGIAGGAAVLGGVVVAPTLAVGGMLMEAKSRQNLAEAKANYAKARSAAEEMNTTASMLKAIADVAELFSDAIREMNVRMDRVLQRLDLALKEAEAAQSRKIGYKIWQFMYGLIGRKPPLKYRDLNRLQQQWLHLAYAYAQTLKKLLETPILKDDGDINESSHETLEEFGQFLLKVAEQDTTYDEVL
jgi:hypothetical protein